MSLLIVGSTAFDTIETPHGSVENCLGGSSTYTALAARLFCPVQLVSVVGADFPDEHRQFLQGHDIDLAGLETVADGKTFRWHGRYSEDMNSRDTIDVQLNVLGDFKPKVPTSYKNTPFVFLANGAPVTQLAVLDQMESKRFAVADTMNLWIEHNLAELRELLPRLDGLILNDEEAKQLTGKGNLIQAGRAVLELGPKLAIVKKGEHGCFLFSHFFHYALPAYPTETVVDPTGAGDSFAGGFMGYLSNTDSVTVWNLKRAIAYGTVAASITVEGFGTQSIAEAERGTIEARYRELMQFLACD